MSASLYSRPNRADTLGLLVGIERAVELLADHDLNHPDVVEALGRLGHNRHLMRLIARARLAHHEAAQTQLTRALAIEFSQADSDPAASAVFAEAL
jgi:hypothetical protein